VWTEPHSRRIKVKLTIQKEVFNGAIMQQSFVVLIASHFASLIIIIINHSFTHSFSLGSPIVNTHMRVILTGGVCDGESTMHRLSEILHRTHLELCCAMQTKGNLSRACFAVSNQKDYHGSHFLSRILQRKHKRTFYYLEQLLLKHSVVDKVLSVKVRFPFDITTQIKSKQHK
jgi:hypothetical protein